MYERNNKNKGTHDINELCPITVERATYHHFKNGGNGNSPKPSNICIGNESPKQWYETSNTRPYIKKIGGRHKVQMKHC